MIQNLFDSIVGLLGLWPAVLLFMGAGVAGLKYGADWLVGGASNLGFRLGLSSAMIGLTIVALGTSAPELVVSVLASFQGKPTLSLGNVVGSNIANTSFILGATALVYPLHIKTGTIRFDGPFSLVAIALVFVLGLIGLSLSRFDGILLLAIFTLWMVWLVHQSLRANKEKKKRPVQLEEEVVFIRRTAIVDLALIALGLGFLVLGADALVLGAVATAKALNVSDVIVGLTIVAAGTSLPELAVCLVAAFKKNADITVGNVLGSNVFNALLILGAAIVVMPIVFGEGAAKNGDPTTLFLDIPLCMLLCAAIIPMMAHNRILGRGKGLILLLAYFAYLTSLIFRAGDA